MRKKTGIALMLSMALMLSSVSVGATGIENEVSPVPSTTSVESTTPAMDNGESLGGDSTPKSTPETTPATVPTEETDGDEEQLPEEKATENPVEPEKTVAEPTVEPEKEDKQEVAPTTVVNTIGPVSIQADGRAFVSDANGKRVTVAGTPIISGNKYYVDANGYLKKGWLYLTNWKMYFDSDTYAAKVGMADIDGKKYLFNSDGVMQNYAGTTVIDGKKYWFSTDNASLKTGWLQLGNWKLYFDPETYEAKTGLAVIDEHTYMFNNDGVAQTYAGTPVINGKKYWVTPQGYLASGWLYLGKWKMYFDSKTFTAKTGMADINGKRYLFNNDGVMQNYAGTTVINGKKYWFSTDDASLKTGWLNLGNLKLYFDPKTYQAVTGIIAIGSEYYYFNDDGAMVTGFTAIGSSYYYFNEDGTMLRNGSKTIYGTKLNFGADGICTSKVALANYNGPYLIKVDRTNCVVTVYGDDGSGNFGFPIKAFVCSVGLPRTPTPAGTFYTGTRYKVKELMGPSWGQYSTHVIAGIYFHSVAAGSASDPGHTVPVGGYYALGRPASHGCIRLLVGDAYWMYTHIKPGTKVIIGDNFPMPLGKPSVPKMVTSGVDPTDPFNK